MKQSELKQLIKEQILAEVKAVSHNQQIYGFNVNGERINFELDKNNDLVCTKENLKTLIVNNPQVKGIFCSANQLTILELGYLPNLEKLYCYGNQLTNLNLSGCSNLKNLECSYNKLTSLNISKCPNLEPKSIIYDKGKTQLITAQELNEVEAVSHNQQIYGETTSGEIINFKLDEFNNLNCFEKNLKTLVVNNPKVKTILCSYNQLTILKLSRLPNLETLSCGHNQLTTLNISNCLNLKTLHCDDNYLTSLNISKCPNLEELDCSYNKLTTLDVSMYLKLSNNNLYYDKDKTQLIK